MTTTKLSSQAEPSIPELCGTWASKPYSPRCRVPVDGKEVDGLINCADSFVVQADLVPAHKLMGKVLVTLAEASCQWELPLATIFIETPPFYVDCTEAVVMEKPVVDLLIANKAKSARWKHC